MNFTEYIESFVAKDYSYRLVVDDKTYLLFRHDKVPCKAAPPRMYPSIQPYADDMRDYVVWHSDENGIQSPWGVGQATVNLSRCLKRTMRV